MKKILSILLLLITANLFSQGLILTENTVIDTDENYSTVRTNGFNLTVNGSLVVTNFLLLNGGGVIFATDDIIVGSNIFFLEDEGTVKSDTGISVGSDITGVGTIQYCTFLQTGVTPEDSVTIIQDCSLSIPLKEYIKNVPIGEVYQISNELGQIIEERKLKDLSDIYSKTPNRFIYFPRLKYGDRMILKIN